MDTWSPGYLMFIEAMHNGISRLYETFGNDDADAVKRIFEPDGYERAWLRPDATAASPVVAARQQQS